MAVDLTISVCGIPSLAILLVHSRPSLASDMNLVVVGHSDATVPLTRLLETEPQRDFFLASPRPPFQTDLVAGQTASSFCRVRDLAPRTTTIAAF